MGSLWELPPGPGVPLPDQKAWSWLRLGQHWVKSCKAQYLKDDVKSPPNHAQFNSSFNQKGLGREGAIRFMVNGSQSRHKIWCKKARHGQEVLLRQEIKGLTSVHQKNRKE